MKLIYIYHRVLDGKDYFLWGSTIGFGSYLLAQEAIENWLGKLPEGMRPGFLATTFFVELPASVKAPDFLFGKEVQS